MWIINVYSPEKCDVLEPFKGKMLTIDNLTLQLHVNTLQDVSFKTSDFFPVNL